MVIENDRTSVEKKKRFPPPKRSTSAFDYSGLSLTGLEFSPSDQALLAQTPAGENYVRILYALALASVSDVNTILEIGAGVSTAVFVHALHDAGRSGPKVCSIDTDPAVPSLEATTLADSLGVNWNVVRSDSLKAAFELLPVRVDLLYIDGDHGGLHAIGDYRRYSPLVHAGGLIVYDDYPLFSGPEAAVATLNAEGVVGRKLTYNLQDGNSFYVIRKGDHG